MLSIKERGTMLNIIKHCQRIEEKIKGITKEAFFANEDIKEIVCFNVLQIGELVKTLQPGFLSKYNKMPWKDIKGMRDWVAHGYGTIDLDKVWKTATNDIRSLRLYCEKILTNN